MSIREILKILRQSKGMTQNDIAEKLGVSLSSYQKYEREKNPVIPSLDVLIRISDFYGESIDYILGREKSNNRNYDDRKLKEGLKEVYLSLPPSIRANILQAMVDAVLSYQQNEPMQPAVQDVAISQNSTEEPINPRIARTTTIGALMDEAEARAEEEISAKDAG